MDKCGAEVVAENLYLDTQPPSRKRDSSLEMTWVLKHQCLPLGHTSSNELTLSNVSKYSNIKNLWGPFSFRPPHCVDINYVQVGYSL